MEKFTENLSVEQYLVESEKTLSAKYRYSETDPLEIELYTTLKDVFESCGRLDITKKRKFYGKPVDPVVQISIFDAPEKFYKADPAEKILHGIVGICTEAGELAEVALKNKFEGIEYDPVHIGEEISDLMWYVAILLREFDLDFHQLLAINIEKLKARYGDKFDAEKANIRDLKKEREILNKTKRR